MRARERMDDAVLEALGRRYTAAVVRVERGGRLAYEGAFGGVDDGPDSHRVAARTPFDLASLTKLFVAASALEAVADGSLPLDAPVARSLVPEWQGSVFAEVTSRMLLAHTAGLRSGADYRTLFGEDVEAYARRPVAVAAPGERVVYSDLGFITLGVVLARARRASLAAVVHATAARAGATEVRYRPGAALVPGIPATELDPWRGRVRGTVHDEKAALMGGVAGHAGLFGTAADVAALGERTLGVLRGRANGIVPEDLVRESVAEQAFDETLRRGLGWALKTRDDNSCGPKMSRATFGHTGFTGTSLWIDPERDLSVTILTNAVYGGRSDLRDVRIRIADAAVDAFS